MGLACAASALDILRKVAGLSGGTRAHPAELKPPQSFRMVT